jgi:chromosome segregation ATPase
MTNEEMEKTMQFILEQQAQFTANFQRVELAREKDSARITRLEESFQLLVRLAESHDERLVTLDKRLVTLAEAQIRASEQIAAIDKQIAAMNERTAETDERLNALIAVVERYISSKGQNGSAQS